MKTIHAAIVIALSSALVMCHKNEDAKAPKPLSVETTEAGVTLRVSTANCEIRVGDPLQVVLEVDRGADTSVTMPNFSKNLGNFEVRSSAPLPKNPTFPDRVAEQLTLVTFEDGEKMEVPPFEVVVRDGAGKESSLKSPPLAISVQSRLEGQFNPTVFRDIKGPVGVPLETQWAWIIGLCVLIAVMGVGAYRWWFHRPAELVIIEAPHERALRELNELAARELPNKGLVLDFYVLLSDAVRHYVEGRFGIHAPEQTTKEFLTAARHHPQIVEDHQRLLASFLRAADMVKYAAQRPGPSECDRGLDAARGFVRESAPTIGHDEFQPPSQATQETRS
ncbi:MAG: hypothetical protein EXS12_08125 [Phycisphaerales bacterium]|nr:hypothetical protein [Phycisphaerales bacterium]